MLFGTSNGSVGMIGRRATIVSSSGLTRTVSFQPSSDASGGMMMLSQVTRLRSWTLNRWKWIGWVSTPLWVIFQIWVPSAPELIGLDVDVALRKVGPVDDLGRRRDVRVEQDVLPGRRRRHCFEAEVGRHPSELVEGGRVHLVVERLRLDLDLLLRLTLEGVEPEGLTALLGDAGEPVALVGGGLVGAVTARDEVTCHRRCCRRPGRR